MIRSCLPWTLLGATLLMASCARPLPEADLILTGGKIYTVNPSQPMVEAVAVIGDTIALAGTYEDVKKMAGDKTQILDLKGKMMAPGFIEGHGHFMGMGYNALQLDLMDVKSYDELVERVRNAVNKAKPGQWIVGRGWHQDKWTVKPEKMVKGFQVHGPLSEVSPDNPVFLRHASGHAGFANAKAMSMAGLHALSLETVEKEVGGGEVIRDEQGNATGIFNERAMGLITRLIPDNTEDTDRMALDSAIQLCWRNGITSFHDAGTSRQHLALFKEYQQGGKLGVRLYAMIGGGDRGLVAEWYKKGALVGPWLTVRSIKLSADGALGSRGAWLLEPYSDRPGHYGHGTLSMDTVLKTAQDGLTYGFQVCVHAIGDRANQEVLDQFEKAFQANPEKAQGHRFRIEHAQHLHPNDIGRFGKLGVVPAMQAIHLSSDRPWAIDRLGKERIEEGAYVWRKLLDSGARIVNGTDVPVEPIDPIACFYASVTRKTLEGKPEGGYEGGQKMTREEALRSYTLDAAYGAFEEGKKGSIERGKYADFTVFSDDLMEVEEGEIRSIKVTMTLIGGKVVYRRP